jgi:hypothetical protein
VIDESATGRSDAPADPDVPVATDEPVLALDLDAATRAALAALPGRSSDPLICPFLRTGAGGDQAPEAAISAHRCVAVAPSVAVTDRQRQLVCQVATHPTCPRHVRGEAAVRASLAPGLGRRSRTAPVAIGTAVVLLVAAAAVAATSGVATPGDGHDGGAGDAAGGNPTTAANAGTRAPQGTERLAPSSTPAGPSASNPGGSGTPAATLAPAPTVRPTLVATRDLPVAWRGLEACPAPDACFLYVVRRGDTFSAIAARFETTTKRLRKLNPTLDDPNTIRVGSTIRVPPPPS